MSEASGPTGPGGASVPGAVAGEDIVGGAVAPDAGDDAERDGRGAGDAVQADAGDTATATEAPRASNTVANTQDEPAMDVHEASADDKIDGIVAQTRLDVGGEGPERIADVLRQRFEDTGIDVSDADRGALAERIASGS